MLPQHMRAGDVPGSPRTYCQHNIATSHMRTTGHLILGLRQMLILVAVQLRKSPPERMIRKLSLLDRAIPVAIRPEQLVNRQRSHPILRIISRRKTGRVQNVVVTDHRSHIDDSRHPAHTPHLCTRLKVIRDDTQSCQHHNLSPTIHIPDQRSRIIPQKFRPVLPPDLPPAATIINRNEGIHIVVLHHHHPLTLDHR